MLGSAALETAIGLVFIYLVLSIVGTAAVEVFSAATNSRAANLRRWIVGVLGRKKADEFYDFPLISCLRKNTTWKRFSYPSYISESTFAEGLAYFLAGQECTTDPDAVSEGAKHLKGTEVGVIIPILAAKANGDFDAFISSVKKWFTEGQDRVTGWFKVSSIAFLLLIGIAISIAGNIDTVEIANRLYVQTTIRQEITNAAAKPSPDALAGMRKLEQAKLMGWEPDGLRAYYSGLKRHDTHDVTKTIGFILTALAMSLGAPYWFEVLNKMNQAIRATGTKPSAGS